MEYNLYMVGEKIRNERKKKGWSQTQLIDLLENKGIYVGRNTISQIENGLKDSDNFSLKLLCGLAELFECEVCYLLGDYEAKTKTEDIIQSELHLSHEAIEYLRNNWYDADHPYNPFEYSSDTEAKQSLPSQYHFIYALNHILSTYPELIAHVGRLLLDDKLFEGKSIDMEKECVNLIIMLIEFKSSQTKLYSPLITNRQRYEFILDMLKKY